MTGNLSLYHLCIAALLAGCASIPQLDAGEPAAAQAGTYPAFLSARDLRAAIGTDQPSQPAATARNPVCAQPERIADRNHPVADPRF